MSDENLAGVHLRLIQLAAATGVPGNDLETMITNELPNGAFAWCNNVKTLFTLDKASDVAVNGDSVLTAHGGGRWLALGAISQVAYSGFLQWDVLSGSATPALVQNTWAALPSAASNFSASNATQGRCWTLNTTSGVMTYAGPNRSYQFTAQLSGFATTGTTTNFGFAVSRSTAALIGTTTDVEYEAQQECAAQEERTWSITGIISSLESGETLQACIRNIDGTETFTVLRYTMVITPLG